MLGLIECFFLLPNGSPQVRISSLSFIVSFLGSFCFPYIGQYTPWPAGFISVGDDIFGMEPDTTEERLSIHCRTNRPPNIRLFGGQRLRFEGGNEELVRSCSGRLISLDISRRGRGGRDRHCSKLRDLIW